jgi:hypothetical protein
MITKISGIKPLGGFVFFVIKVTYSPSRARLPLGFCAAELSFDYLNKDNREKCRWIEY